MKRGIASAFLGAGFALCAPACVGWRAPAQQGTLGPQATAIPYLADGGSCQGGSPSRFCLALKYVAFDDAAGAPAVARASAIAGVRAINAVWDQCGIAFEIEQFAAVSPVDYGINYGIGDYTELDQVREAFRDDDKLLVVTTGPWNRRGSLGDSSANAWTSMPGGAPYGVILEKPVGTFANIIAHELGHYLNLTHQTDAKDLMNPIIYAGSTRLSAAQCAQARQSAGTFWRRTRR